MQKKIKCIKAYLKVFKTAKLSFALGYFCTEKSTAASRSLLYLVNGAAHEAGVAAELAASRSEEKHAELYDDPCTLSNLSRSRLWAFSARQPASSCLSLVRGLLRFRGETRETCFVFQCCSVLVQLFYADLYCMTCLSYQIWLHGLIIVHILHCVAISKLHLHRSCPIYRL